MKNLDSQVVSGSATVSKSESKSEKASRPAEEPVERASERLTVEAVFCPADVKDPLDTVPWDLRCAVIQGEGGEVFFEQNDCEVPSSWTQLATNVVVSKYFYGEVGTSERETSVRDLIHRVSRTIADWGTEDGYFATPEDGERFYRELTWLCLHQHASFNSPVWFNVGLFPQYGVKGAMCNWHWDRRTDQVTQPENPYEYPQGSACFIQSVQDNMEDIMDLARSEAMLFKFGSGTGTDLSTLRSHREKLSGGGRPSGPLSFMRVYDQVAAVVKSGGKTRRAAKMQSLKVWHPDVMEFIQCKCKEEEKARLLAAKGYDHDDAYSSVLFQNANLSVRVSDEFMEAAMAGKPWTTHWVTEPETEGPTYPARDVLNEMARAAWGCGDPGLQYDSTINRWHTCPNSGRINASNPCSEYMFVDDSACNLASLNLMKFRSTDGGFEVDRFLAACRIVLIAQEILVGHSSYPTERIARNSHRFRPLGLGYSNLGSLLMASGLPYDSDEARGLCGAITALLHGAACRTSSQLAAAVGPFEAFAENRRPMLKVMEMHWEKVEKIGSCPTYLKEAARKVWDEVLAQGRRHGFRNAQATVLAPTGTISFMMDCDTTGIEPDIALVKYKQLAGGGMLKIVNQTVPLVLQTLGYDEAQIKSICDYIDREDSIEGAADLKAEHLPVFDCAFSAPNRTRSIRWQAHLEMMAAAQPFLSGAISKTVNMPKESTPEDIAKAYEEGWRLGLKSLAVYRDGSKGAQPLSTKDTSEKEEEPAWSPRRERLPDTRQSLTHKFSIAGHEGYITVGLYPDGRPGEMFITMAKEGSTIGGLMDCFGTAVSMSLQYGVPLEVYVNKFSHTRFEPMGHTKNPDIRIAKSIVDYIFRWLGITFVPGYRESNGMQFAARGVPERGSGEAETESRPAATKAGGPNAGHGSAETSNASSPTTSANRSTNGSSVQSSNGNGHAGGSGRPSPSVQASMATLQRVKPAPQLDWADPFAYSNELFASFQADAPSCDACGAITVRNGNCYLCHNCGNSMGCS